MFDHTADMGIRIRAASLPELLEPARQGLYAAVGELFGTGDPIPLALNLEGESAPVLFRDYLGELLALFDRDARIVVGLEAKEFNDRLLEVVLQTAPVDEERSVYHREVKAVTYHELDIRTIPGGYEAVFIVDI